VPRHRLGDEIGRDLAEAGVTARVYRGRDALDPEADDPEAKMCRDIGRVELIEGALASAAAHACRYRDRECEFYHTCGYQRQRAAEPDVWVVPHQLLFRRRPSFIPQPSALAIDEAFWSAGLRGIDTPYRVSLDALIGDRSIPGSVGDTADLVEVSRAVHGALAGEPEGRVRRAALARIPVDDLRLGWRLEWRRKLDLDTVLPGVAIETVQKVCARVAEHNRLVAKLARLWVLLARTAEAPEDRSPWIDLRLDEPPGTDAVMAWRENIHSDWRAPTICMDAIMPTKIVREFFPGMEDPLRVAAPMPHARVRQITDRPMAASMLIPSEFANEATNATRRANVERLRGFIEVCAADVRPGKVLVIGQLGLEVALVGGDLPVNIEVAHFNNVAGLNDWSHVALLIVVGRTEPSPGTVERTARALFGCEIADVPPDRPGNRPRPGSQPDSHRSASDRHFDQCLPAARS
jgi:putative DNA primase/helicase